MNLPARIARKVELSPDCWTWTGALTEGYGRIKWGGRLDMAHRVVYAILVGPVPDGLQLDHLCRNRACVNPAHLEPVTQAVNMQRAAEAWMEDAPGIGVREAAAVLGWHPTSVRRAVSQGRLRKLEGSPWLRLDPAEVTALADATRDQSWRWSAA